MSAKKMIKNIVLPFRKLNWPFILFWTGYTTLYIYLISLLIRHL